MMPYWGSLWDEPMWMAYAIALRGRGRVICGCLPSRASLYEAAGLEAMVVPGPDEMYAFRMRPAKPWHDRHSEACAEMLGRIVAGRGERVVEVVQPADSRARRQLCDRVFRNVSSIRFAEEWSVSPVRRVMLCMRSSAWRKRDYQRWPELVALMASEDLEFVVGGHPLMNHGPETLGHDLDDLRCTDAGAMMRAAETCDIVVGEASGPIMLAAISGRPVFTWGARSRCWELRGLARSFHESIQASVQASPDILSEHFHRFVRLIGIEPIERRRWT